MKPLKEAMKETIVNVSMNIYQLHYLIELDKKYGNRLITLTDNVIELREQLTRSYNLAKYKIEDRDLIDMVNQKIKDGGEEEF